MTWLLLTALLADFGATYAPTPAPTTITYAKFLALVESGTPCVLHVGVPAEAGAYRCDTLEGFAPGVYNCYRENGKAVMAPRVTVCVNGRCP